MTPVAALRMSRATRARAAGTVPGGDARRGLLPPATLRTAAAADVSAISVLIQQYAREARLLPRSAEEIARHIDRFVVAEIDDEVVACADLAPLSPAVAEVRSFVVDRHARGSGLGRRMMQALVTRAMAGGYQKLCAFTHSPGWFVRTGFSIVPHTWLPEKVATDCHSCAQFRQCGQYAMLFPNLHD